ncbi:hypothetical protein [Luteibacter sp. 329MFSha]|uniref:hypothetical protein n=1 Tax=Luteibacter sp. 329MFSha TaxID=1798239 RepID=UPI00111467C5|nr:hypothetical protein [Luteibacter sp. 329MFSha]
MTYPYYARPLGVAAGLLAVLVVASQASAIGVSGDGRKRGGQGEEATVLSATSLTGRWVSLTCSPSGSDDLAKCDFFYLTLLQEGNEVCGQHDAGLAGASRLDEGYAGSVMGSVSTTGAVVGIRSGRSGALLRARIVERSDTLVWSVVGTIEPARYPDISSIPSETVLRRQAAALAEAAVEQLAGACKGANRGME